MVSGSKASFAPPSPSPSPPQPAGATFEAKPADGAYVSGLFLEGARWSASRKSLVESAPKVLHSPAPLIWFKPCAASKRKVFPAYDCPVYRTAERRGVLATTGHSSNFVLDLALPSDLKAEHWIKRGVAMLLSLSI